MYGLTIATPLRYTVPLWMRSVSPGRPIVRLMKSFGWINGGGKTTMSPSCGLEKRYSNSLTSSTSWICSVGSIDPLGMKNVRTTNVMRNSATSPATMNASRYSRMTVRVEGALGTSPFAPARTGSGRKLIATRTIAKSAISPSSSSGVTRKTALLRGLAFLDAGRLADSVAEVVQARAADDAALRNFDAIDARAVQQERAFHADAVGDAADGDRLGWAAVLTDRHDAFEHLDAFFAALDDLRVDFDGVARTEIRDGRLFLFLLDQVEYVHDSSSVDHAKSAARGGGQT